MKRQIKITAVSIVILLLAGCAKKTNLKALINSKPEKTVQKSENNVNVKISTLPSKAYTNIPFQLLSHIKNDKYAVLVVEIDNFNEFSVMLKAIESDLMGGDFIYDKCKYNPFLRGSAGLLATPVIAGATSAGMILSGAVIGSASAVGYTLISGGLILLVFSGLTLPIWLVGGGIGFGVYYNNLNEELKKEIAELIYYNQKNMLFEQGQKQKFMIFVKEPLDLKFNFEKSSETNSSPFSINFNNSDFVK